LKCIEPTAIHAPAVSAPEARWIGEQYSGKHVDSAVTGVFRLGCKDIVSIATQYLHGITLARPGRQSVLLNRL